jgi:hypothetical protein
LDLIPETQATKAKTDRNDYVKIKSFDTVKKMISGVRRWLK